MKGYLAARYQANRERLDPVNRAWYANRPGVRKEQAKRDYERRRERILAYNREYGQKNRERRSAYLKEYREKNPELIAAHKRRYKAMKRGAEGSHTGDDVLALFKAQRGKCGYCRTSLKGGYHVDHIKPLSKRGSNKKTNLQLLCEACNLKKHALDPIEFANRIGLLV